MVQVQLQGLGFVDMQRIQILIVEVGGRASCLREYDSIRMTRDII